MTAASVDEALVALGADDFDVVISDVQLPGASGLELLRTVKENAPDCVVIMITAFATTETAIEAMKQGAYDYVTKPFKVDELRLVVEKALEKKLLTDENQRLRTALRARSRSLVGTSEAMRARPRPDRAGRHHADERARERRERHRQGARRARASTSCPSAARSRSSP